MKICDLIFVTLLFSCDFGFVMKFDDPRRNPFHNPENRPSGWLLVGIAVAVSVAVTLLAWVLLYMRAVFNTQPLG